MGSKEWGARKGCHEARREEGRVGDTEELKHGGSEMDRARGW